jgi:AraC family transcriptional activator of pobA
MRKMALPIYNINDFTHLPSEEAFYTNDFISHLKDHHFINTPHKHDFYLTIFFTKGSGIHEIDFNVYDIKPGSIFLLSPGQTHHWKLSNDIDGYVFFHSKAFFNIHFNTQQLHDFPFLGSIYNSPVLYLSTATHKAIEPYFKEIITEYHQDKAMKYPKLCSLINLIYIELKRSYNPIQASNILNQHYLDKIKTFEALVNIHFKTEKSPKAYAAMMHITAKHLNRIAKESLNKTTSDIITDRIVLEAKRLLVQAHLSVAQIANELGYLDNAYFSRLFRKKCNETPLAFLSKKSKF